VEVDELEQAVRARQVLEQAAAVSLDPADLVELLLHGGDRQRAMRLGEHWLDVGALRPRSAVAAVRASQQHEADWATVFDELPVSS
jgi:hypothetical protein